MFHQKRHYQTLSIEEAEQKIAQKTRGLQSQDRWMMHKLKKQEEDEDDVKIKKEGVPYKERTFKVSDARQEASHYKEDVENEELDFEEDFQDDDGLIELGLDDADENKEATRRALGGFEGAVKKTFEDSKESVESKGLDKMGKKLKKSLMKVEKKEVLESDEEDPYATSEDDEDEEENLAKEREAAEALLVKETSTPMAAFSPEALMAASPPATAPSPPPTSTPAAVPATTAKPVKKRKELEGASANIFMKKSKKGASARGDSKSPMSVGNGSPAHEVRESSPLGRTSSPGPTADRKIKISLGNASPLSDSGAQGRKRGREDEAGPGHKIKLVKSGSQSPPPPPSAAEVIAREQEKERQRKMRKISMADRAGSASPPPTSPMSIASSRPQSPPSTVSSPPATGTPQDGKVSPALEADKVKLEQEVIKVLTAHPNIEVSVLVSKIKHLVKNDPAMKEAMKQILKKVAIHDKATKTLKLK